LAGELDTPRRLAKLTDLKRGWAVLDGIDPDDISAYQPYWAVRADLLRRLEETFEAVDAFDRAIGLADDPALYLAKRTEPDKIAPGLE
jgi:predicted RNA polymerase sigma factor